MRFFLKTGIYFAPAGADILKGNLSGRALPCINSFAPMGRI
jgi:hypothetical protein